MPRQGRKKSESGIYHVMIRGINKQVIFEDDEDREKLLETIKHYKTVSKYNIYGYCLMDNHVHLLIKETEESISKVMKRISGSYVYWYNWKYDRCGHLFQGRFRSEEVESEEYFLTVIRYIHQNPMRAGLTKSIEEYQWSSIHEYIEKPTVIDTDFVLNMFSNNNGNTVHSFIKYMNEENDDKCLDYEEKHRVTDDEVRSHFKKQGIIDIDQLNYMEKSRRNEIIKVVKLIDGVTIRQISRITGISKSIIGRI